MQLNPIAWLIYQLIDLLSLVLLIWVIMSLLIQFQILNRYQPLVNKVFTALSRLIDPILQPIRKRMPDLGGIDVSPIALILLLQFIQYSIVYYL
jgi:YggT family protein